MIGSRHRAAGQRLDSAIIRARALKASAALGAALLAASCGRGGDWRTPSQSSQSSAAQARYVAPPRFTAAARLGDGNVEIVGRADRNSHIRLTSPDGASLTAVTDSRGAFTIEAPRPQAVRLFGLAEDVAGRQVRGTGYLAILPTPGPAAVVLHAGTGAEALGAPSAAPRIATVDFDASGAAVVSGLARPGSPLKATVDGVAGAEGRANAQGRYALTLTAAVKPGDHDLVVTSPLGASRARFRVSAAVAISGLPFRYVRQANGWRVDWLTPAGGEQSTLVLD